MADKKNKKKRKVRGKILFAILGLFMGWIAHVGYVYIDKISNRPILDFETISLFVFNVENESPNMQIVIRQVNTGNSQAIYNIRDCVIYFPKVNPEPINISLNKSMTLKERSFRTDTIIIPFPSMIKFADFSDFASIGRVDVHIDNLLSEHSYTINRDSTELLFGVEEYSGDNRPPIEEFLLVDSITGEKKIKFGTHTIIQDGISFVNLFLPFDAKVSHIIENDVITIEVSGQNMSNFLFLPNPNLKNEISVSSHDISYEYLDEERKKYGNNIIENEEIYTDAHFFFFKL